MNGKKYKLAVFDVDGTLVTHKERVLLDSTIDSLLSLQKQGVKLAIASGRAKYSLEKSVLDRVNFDYFINSNGALLYDNKKKCVLDQYEISEDQIIRFTNLGMRTNSSVLAQFTDKGYAYWGYDKMAKMLDETCGRHDFICDHSLEQNHHKNEVAHTFLAYILPNNIDAFKNEFPEFEFLSFLENYYDILPKPRTKASGIERICKDLGIEMNEVIAFGDGTNDIEMLQAVGFGVAMGNAPEVVKQAAHEVTTNSEKHGIYLALRQHQLVEALCID